MPARKLITDLTKGEASFFDQGRVDQQGYRSAFEKIVNLTLENGILTRRLGSRGLLPATSAVDATRLVPGSGPIAFDGTRGYSPTAEVTLNAWISSILGNLLYTYTIPNAISATFMATNEGNDAANRRLLFTPMIGQYASRPGAGALPDVKLKTYYPNSYQGGTLIPLVWDASTSYVAGQKVWLVIGGTVYTCILANTNQTPPNGTYWSISSYDAGWLQPTFDTSGSNEVGGEVIFSLMGRIYTGNKQTGALRASRTQIYQEYGKFSGGAYASNGDTTTTPGYLQKLDGLQTFAPIAPFYMDDPATPSINEAAFGQVPLSADLGIQLLGRAGDTPEYGPIYWISGQRELFFGTSKGIYVLQSGFVYGPSPELGGCTPTLIDPVPCIQATQIKTPGNPGTNQTLPLWADTPNSVCFLSAADELTIFDKTARRSRRLTLGLPRTLAVDTIAWFGSSKYAVLISDLSGMSSGDFRNNYVLIIDEQDLSRTRFLGIAYSVAGDGASSDTGSGATPTDGIFSIRGSGGQGIFLKIKSAGTRRTIFIDYGGAKKYSQASALGVTDYRDFVATDDVTGVIAVPKIRTFPMNGAMYSQQQWSPDFNRILGVAQVNVRVYDTPVVSASVVYTEDGLGTETLTAAQTEMDVGWGVADPYVKDINIVPVPGNSKAVRVELSCRTGQPFNILTIMVDMEAGQ